MWMAEVQKTPYFTFLAELEMIQQIYTLYGTSVLMK